MGLVALSGKEPSPGPKRRTEARGDAAGVNQAQTLIAENRSWRFRALGDVARTCALPPPKNLGLST